MGTAPSMLSCKPSLQDHAGLLQRRALVLISGFEHRVLLVQSGSRGPVCYPVRPLQPEESAFTNVAIRRRMGSASAPPILRFLPVLAECYKASSAAVRAL